jgi:hypothetical protein
MALPSFWQTAKKEIVSLKSFVLILLIALLYFALSTLILNYRLVFLTVTGDYPLSYKLTLIFNLLQGSLTAFSATDFVLLIVTSVLVGLNVLLITKTIMKLKSQKGRLSLSVGGSAVLGLVVAGCSSCGFSVLSLLGLSASLTFIPFGGLSLHLLAIFLLLLSLIYSLRTLHYKVVCKIK